MKNNPFTQQIFYDTEINANILVERSLILGSCVLGIMWILNTLGILAISEAYVFRIFFVGIIAFLIPAVICHIFKGNRQWIKYMLITSVIVTLSYLDVILTFNTHLLIIIPVILSCRYYSSFFTVVITFLTTIFFTLSSYLGAVFNFNNPDMNFANADKYVYVHDVMLQSFLPRWMTFFVFSAVCFEIARCGRKMVIEQDSISKKTARVETELEMAGKIQLEALPSVADLGQNDYRNFDLFAKMTPAKEVGGDFYDFFYPDSTHLAIIIADVADKGIAASLYMMMSKTLLDSRISTDLSPGKVLEEVGKQLHEHSPKGMFVTVWLGILDLVSGKLVVSNAGHEYPALKRKNGSFELLIEKHGCVLGAQKNPKYTENEITLNEGDILFIYTDGVPEANNKEGKMFDLDRMLASLNKHSNCSMEQMIENVKKDIDDFTLLAPTFDDTTMLALKFGKAINNK